MTDLSKVSGLIENNQLEAKRTEDKLPSSLWETYSSFANTDGGVIVLGAKEKSDHTLAINGVSDADKLIRDLWNTLNNRNKISANLLKEKNVYKDEYDGKTVVIIEVPRARRTIRPVYINGNMFGGTYRRNGDGDFCLSNEEVKALVRDAGSESQDMRLVTEMNESAFCPDTLKAYRKYFSVVHQNHIWNDLEDEDFLCKIGAADYDENGKFHPTCAGLLMFGWENKIVREFPQYFLDYQEHFDDSNVRWTDRIVSSSGEWSGNVYDFFFRIINRLQEGLKRPFALDGITRIDDTPMHKAIREALVNALVHADYYGRQGIVVKKFHDKLVFANPGTFRIPLSDALNGGTSDPRNAIMLKLFAFLDIGERAGSGIPGIVGTVKRDFGTEPEYTESFEPERTTVMLKVESEWNQNEPREPQLNPVNDEDEPREPKMNPVGQENEPQMNPVNDENDPREPQNVDDILDVIKKNPQITKEELAEMMGISVSTVKRRLGELKGIVRFEGNSRNGHWVII